MRTLGAVAVVVRALVVGLSHSNIEESLGTLNLRRYLGQIGYFERCTILLDDVHQRNIVEVEFIIFDSELVLRELESLLNKVDVLVLHFSELVKINNPSSLL